MAAGMSSVGRRRGPGRPPIDEVAEGERRSLILRVARLHFAQHGYAAVSLGSIAQEVGVTKAALYYHFRSKDDLYAAMAIDLVHRMAQAVSGITRGPGTVIDRIVALTRAAIMRTPSRIDMDTILRDVRDHLTPEQGREIHQARNGFILAVEDLMREGVERGELRAGPDPRLLAHAFTQLLGGFSGQRGAETGMTGEQMVVRVADLFLYGAASHRGEGS